MGTMTRSILRLPTTPTGEVDRAATLRLFGEYLPIIIALLGVEWLTGSGIAHDHVSLTIALATALPLWIFSRAWRLPWWLHAATASFPLSIALVALLHADPAGLSRATKLAYAVILFVGVVAWARSPKRRLALGLALVALVVFGFGVSWWRWLPASDPWALMRGTLGWHNQFAIHMVAGFAMGITVAVLARRRWAITGGAGAVLAGAGVLMSGSRFAGSLAIAAAVAALAAGLVVSIQRRTLWPPFRWLVVLGGALILPLILRSALFFPGQHTSADPLGTITQRGSPEGSGRARLIWWQSSWEMGLDNPFAGVGLLRFDDLVACYGGRPWWHPHSEWAYAWAEGGLIATIPMLFLLAATVVLVVKSVRPLPTAAVLTSDPARWGAISAFVLSVAHLLTEYNLFYPVLLAMMALSGGIACAPLISRIPRSRRHDWVAWTLMGAVVLVAVAGIAFDPTIGTLPWFAATDGECELNS